MPTPLIGMRVVSTLCWAICGLFQIFAFMELLSMLAEAKSAPQHAAGAAIAACWSIIPYCFARAANGIALATARNENAAEGIQPRVRQLSEKRGATTLLLALALTTAPTALAQEHSDAEIQAAIDRGANTPAKKLWGQIRKKQQYRINRAGFDPIEKKVLLLTDLDRVSLESAEAKRQLRNVSVDEIRNTIPLDVVEVLLEANCYNNLYAGSLAKWGPMGGVHLVLKSGSEVIQPMDKRAGRSDSVSILPQEHGLLTRQGNSMSYTPLYRSAFYERASLRAWFTFRALPSDVRSFTVVAISGEGKQKEKEVENPLSR